MISCLSFHRSTERRLSKYFVKHETAASVSLVVLNSSNLPWPSIERVEILMHYLGYTFLLTYILGTLAQPSDGHPNLSFSINLRHKVGTQISSLLKNDKARLENLLSIVFGHKHSPDTISVPTIDLGPSVRDLVLKHRPIAQISTVSDDDRCSSRKSSYHV